MEHDRIILAVNEACIALESACAVADLLAKSELKDTLPLTQLLAFLSEAIEALGKVRSPQDEPDVAVHLPPPPPIPIPHGSGRVPGLKIVDGEE